MAVTDYTGEMGLINNLVFKKHKPSDNGMCFIPSLMSPKSVSFSATRPFIQFHFCTVREVYQGRRSPP